MKTLGIVGGIGPESTIEYYRFILDGYRARTADGSAPHLIIDSIDVNRGLAMLEANDRAGLADYIGSSVDRLVRAGAEIALIAANTPHLVFDEVQRRAAIPMLSIVQATCDHARAAGLKRLGLLGTGFTMRARFYPEAFERADLELHELAWRLLVFELGLAREITAIALADAHHGFGRDLSFALEPDAGPFGKAENVLGLDLAKFRIVLRTAWRFALRFILGQCCAGPERGHDG